jgi:hypothetical protein
MFRTSRGKIHVELMSAEVLLKPTCRQLAFTLPLPTANLQITSSPVLVLEADNGATGLAICHSQRI